MQFNLVFTIPDALVPRIVAAVRNSYPSETAGLADAPAVRAAIRAWMKTTLAGYEGGLAAQDERAQIVAARQAAIDAALADGDTVV
jgi:hypothetical protein